MIVTAALPWCLAAVSGAGAVRVGYADGGDESAARAGETQKAVSRGAMDEASLAAIYKKHAPAVFAHCRRLLRSPAAARDATHEAFVRVLARGPSSLTGEDALRYLYRVSTNVCLNQLRERRVHERATPALLAYAERGASAESGHADREFAAALLDRCDDTGAAIAVMFYVDGMSQVEIAAVLGITRRTVFNRLRKLEALAAELLGAPARPLEPEDAPAAPEREREGKG